MKKSGDMKKKDVDTMFWRLDSAVRDLAQEDEERQFATAENRAIYQLRIIVEWLREEIDDLKVR